MARTDYAMCALTKIHPDDFVRATASSFEIPSGSPASRPKKRREQEEKGCNCAA